MLKQRQTGNTRSDKRTRLRSSPAESPNIEPATAQNLPEVWQRLLEALAARGPALHSLVIHGKLTAIDDGRAVISYEKKHETFVKLLDRNGKKDVVRDILSQIAGKPLGVKFDITATDATEPMAAPAMPSSSISTAVMEAPTAIAQPPRPQPRREPVRMAVEPPPQAAPPSNVVRITPELKESLRNSEPLIKAIMDELGADIVKVEAAENAV